MSPGDTRTIAWAWKGRTIPLGLDQAGSGPKLLLLPALSSISTRREMAPLISRLQTRFDATAVDWPGFGDQPRPPLDWEPEAYREYLRFLLREIVPTPRGVIAAGHAATYALEQAVADPSSVGRLVLVAPTWRGPLPTMMEGSRPFFGKLRRLVDAPIIGPLVYGLNVNRPMLQFMVAGHVYSNKAWLTGERLASKLAVTRAKGARFASVRFVTGGLDPLSSRDAFLTLARQVSIPMLLIYGAETPPKSRAEIEALAQLPTVETVRLPRGKLSVHEEFPDEVAGAVEGFLNGQSR